jgi:hypothetical protein
MDNLQRILRTVEELKEQKAEVKGAMDEKLKRLKKLFKCLTLKEAVKLLVKIEDEVRELHQRYTKKETELLKKHRKVLK